MIEMRHEKGLDEYITAPIIVCDYCKDEITECRAANLLWLYDEPGRQYHVHKQCDRAFEDAFAVKLGIEWQHFPWMPLDRFLDHVTHNAKLSQARAERERRNAFTVRIKRHKKQR